jgi:RNA polymerase sigma factor (TIGR02999 family)
MRTVTPSLPHLFEARYPELHRLARRQLARERGVLELHTTTLLHEAYLAMSDRQRDLFADCAHFMAYAARVMRNLIIDKVRRRNAQKRGGAWHVTALADASAHDDDTSTELGRISDALGALAVAEADLAQVVDLKFFCGLSFAEIAALLSISERTAQRKWEKARLYLFQALRAG